MNRQRRRDDSLGAALAEVPRDIMGPLLTISERRAKELLHGGDASHCTLAQLLSAAYVAGVTDCTDALSSRPRAAKGET